MKKRLRLVSRNSIPVKCRRGQGIGLSSAEQSRFLFLSRLPVFISQAVSHGPKTITRRESAGRRDHPEHAGPSSHLFDGPDRRRCPGDRPDDRSLIGVQFLAATSHVRERVGVCLNPTVSAHETGGSPATIEKHLRYPGTN